MTGDFNEDTHSNKMQELITETRIFEVFQEARSIEKQCRDPTFENRNKCVDFI